MRREPYRAVVIHSSAHDKRRQKHIDRELKADRKALEHQCKVVYKKDFFVLLMYKLHKKNLERRSVNITF